MKKLLPISTAFFIIFWQVSTALGASITAIPPKVELNLDPGSTVVTELKIRNDSTESQLYAINIDDFIVSDSKGTPIPVSQNLSNRFSLKKWITAPSSVPVDAGETQIIKVTIKTPRDAMPGGHYAMITYQANSEIKPGDLKKTSSLVSQRVGSLILININGDITERAIVKKFTANRFIEQGPVKFEGIIENQSDTHVTPKGNIQITDLFGKTVAKLDITTGSIFPEAEKPFESIWNQKWGYGRYKAELNLAYGLTGGMLTATIFFWLFPIRLVIYTLVFLISVLTIVTLLNRRNRRHQEMLEREVETLKEELEHLESKSKS